MSYENEGIIKKSEMRLSIVLPIYNEEAVIDACLTKINEVAKSLNCSYEIIAVDDGSIDMSLELLVSWMKIIRELRVLRLDKNLGHMSAISAGLEASSGEYVVTIDSDLQDPPEHILEMLELIDQPDKNGIRTEVIQAIRKDRSSDSFLKRTTASAYYKIIRVVTGVEVISDAADFRMMSRRVVNVLNSLPEKNKIYRILIPYLGFKTRTIDITREKRYAGQSKYNIKKMFTLALNSMVGFTFRPLRVVGVLGFALSILMLILAFFYFLLYIKYGDVPGWTSLVLLLLASNALIIASMGLLGEYIGRLYQQSQNRPESLWIELKSE